MEFEPVQEDNYFVNGFGCVPSQTLSKLIKNDKFNYLVLGGFHTFSCDADQSQIISVSSCDVRYVSHRKLLMTVFFILFKCLTAIG